MPDLNFLWAKVKYMYVCILHDRARRLPFSFFQEGQEKSSMQLINRFDVFPKADQAFDLDLCLGGGKKA